MDEQLARLEREFCPPLDSTLVYSIYSDYHDQPDGLEQARAVLAQFKDSAVVEQLTDFDPSGCSGQNAQNDSSPEKGQSSHGPRSSPTETDATSLTNGLSSLGLSSSHSGTSSPSESSANMEWFQNLDVSAKEKQLQETFPTLKATTISFILKKCKGDYEKATDELLNHVLFEEMDGVEGEEKVTRKGVDSFAVGDSAPRGRKAKAKKKAKYMNLDEYARSSSEPASPTQNKWKTVSEDIKFIAAKVNTSDKIVSSLYHKNGGSLPATIMALVELDVKENKKAPEEEGEVVVQNAIDLATEFAAIIEPQQAFALIRLTHPSSAAAHELAKALANNSKGKAVGGIELIPRYAPINLSEAEQEQPTLRSSSVTPNLAPQNSAALQAARHDAFTKASAYHRMGKSDKHMKAVAGYYSQVGRDSHRAYKEAVAAEADSLVASQSSPAQLDLHGVSVNDAKRIARQKVGEWWNSLGEQRIRSFAGGRVSHEYRIITGMGRHSDGGRAKIGPAVMKMLVTDGWKIEVGSGILTVTGMRKMG